MFAEVGARTTHDFGNAAVLQRKRKFIAFLSFSAPPPEGGEAEKDAYLAFTGYSLLARR